MGIINRLFILFSFIVTIIVCLEYKKNKSIKFQEKIENSNRLQEIGSLQTLQENIKNFNSIIVFCVTYSNYCEEYIKTLEKVSSYKLTLGIEFLKVDCTKHKLDICDVFQISAFPTIKVYLQRQESFHFPLNPDTESILEFVDKINSHSILKFKSYKEILNFSNNYGDSSFMLVRKENVGNSENSYFNALYDCYEKIAEDINYRPIYYFSEISASKFKNSRNSNEIKTPAIMNLGINSEYNIHLSFTSSTTCDDIKNFIDENKYPIMKRLDENYLSRVKRDKRILFIAAIFTKEITHIHFLKTFLHNVAFVKRKYVFSFLDANEDQNILRFFNLNSKDIPKIVIYDFSIGKYFIDNFSYLNDEDSMTKLNNLIGNIENGNIRWTSGYLLEDFLETMGIKISRNILLVIFLFVVTLIFIVLGIVLCNFLDKIKEVRKIKKE